jgi:ATP/maltotriose-dependent transcriptional regulator MalT
MGKGSAWRTAPRLGSQTIDRRRLIPLFDRVAETGTLLVSAGAGHGKSTALSSWVLGQEDVVVAWVNCGEEHNDPLCLAEQLVSMLHETILGARVGTVGEIADAVAASDDVVVVVLDDVHHLTSPLVWSAVEDLVRRRPDNLRIVVSGRDEGGLPWHRLRSEREVTEIGADDLCFTEDEASALLTRTYGIEDADEVVGDLLAATQGWAVGLCLAGQALRHGATDVVAAPELGRHRYLRGYFDEELLAGLKDDDVHFLEVTCLLDRLDPGLCDILTGRSDSQALLEQFVEHNLFTQQISVLPPVFRFHQLFAEYLRTRTSHSDATMVAEHLGTASHWYEEHGLPDLAIEAAVRAGDLERVESLVREASGPMLRAGFPHRVERWLSALPQSSFDANPDLALLFARSAGATGHVLAARSGLASVDSRIHSTSEPASPSLLLARQNLAVVTALWAGDLEAAGARLGVAEAIAEEHPDRPEEDIFGLAPSAVRAYRGLLHFLNGDLDEAIRHVERILTASQLVHPDKDAVLLVGVRALAMAWRGESRTAREAVEQSRVAAAAFHGNTGGRLSLLAAGAWCSDLDLAESDLAEARAIVAHAPMPIYCAVYRLAEARFWIRAGRLPAAEASLEAAHDIIAAMPSAPFLAAVEHDLRSDITAARSDGAEVSLNERELAVLGLIAAGVSRREAAEQLYLSVNTVKTYLRSAYRKLSASNRDDAIERARTLGMLDQTVPSDATASPTR